MQEDNRIREELGELKGQLSALPATILSVVQPELEKTSEKIVKTVCERIEVCQSKHEPKIEAIEEVNKDIYAKIQNVENKQARVGYMIALLALAFVGSLSGGALKDLILGLLRGFLG